MNCPPGRSRMRRTVGVCVVAVMLLAACTVGSERDGRRGPTPLGDQYYVVDETTVGVEVQSCNGEPELREVQETDTEIRIEVVATTYREGDDCQDSITVELGDPLGDRAVIDMTTDDRLVSGDQ